MPAEGSEVLELAAPSVEEKASWLKALSATAPIANLQQHPRAAELT
jgi:hypothetical protein